MFIDWEKRHAFHDTLDAMVWQRATHDASRVLVMWEYEFASTLDKVKDSLKQIKVR